MSKKVYLVEDCENAPGRILCVFDNEEAAINFADGLDIAASVDVRTIYSESPSYKGYNV